MRHGKINLVDLDFEYKCWKTRLELFIKEVDILFNRNEEVKSEPDLTELNEIELIVLEQHRDDLDKFHRRLVLQEEQLEFYSADFPIIRTHSLYDEHITLRRKMEHISAIHLEKMKDMIVALGV